MTGSIYGKELLYRRDVNGTVLAVSAAGSRDPRADARSLGQAGLAPLRLGGLLRHASAERKALPSQWGKDDEDSCEVAGRCDVAGGCACRLGTRSRARCPQRLVLHDAIVMSLITIGSFLQVKETSPSRQF